MNTRIKDIREKDRREGRRRKRKRKEERKVIGLNQPMHIVEKGLERKIGRARGWGGHGRSEGYWMRRQTRTRTAASILQLHQYTHLDSFFGFSWCFVFSYVPVSSVAAVLCRYIPGLRTYMLIL